MATPNAVVVRLVLRFVPPRELGRTASVNKAWQSTADTQWTQTVGHPKGPLNLLLSASQRIQRLERWRTSFLGKEQAGSELAEGCTMPFRAAYCLGLLMTLTMGVMHADGNSTLCHKVPSWLDPLPFVISGAPLIVRLCVFVCARFLRRCFVWRTQRTERALLESTRPSRAEFNDMEAVLNTSQSLVVNVRQAVEDVERCDRLHTSHATRDGPDFGINLADIFFLPLWASALLYLLPLPAVVQFAPLYCACIVMASFPNKFYVDFMEIISDDVPERIGVLIRPIFVALAISISILCLQLNGLLHSALTVAVAFWIFVAVMGTCSCFIAVASAEEWPDDFCGSICIVAAGGVCCTIALSSASIGIAALLAKVTGGIFAVIPYFVIVFVLLLCVPALCLFSFHLWVALTTNDWE